MYKCLLDLDGVLVDLEYGLRTSHGLQIHGYRGKKQAKFVEDELGLTSEELWRQASSEWWAMLPWTPDGQTILQLIEQKFSKENVCLLTMPLPRELNGRSSVIGKVDWVHRHLPDYDRRYLIGAAKEFCAGSEHKVLIDDSEHNIASFNEAGGKGFLLPRKWNDAHADSPQALTKLIEFLDSLEK